MQPVARAVAAHRHVIPADLSRAPAWRCRPSRHAGRWRQLPLREHAHSCRGTRSSPATTATTPLTAATIRPMTAWASCPSLADEFSADPRPRGRDPMGAMTSLVLFSAGQDSTVCLAWALEHFARVETIGFAYGQRHSVEMTQRPVVRAKMAAAFPTWASRLGDDHVLELATLSAISDTALTRRSEERRVG